MKAFLDAHMSLGRLVERLSSPGASDLWELDAIRRDALADSILRGCPISLEEVSIAALSPIPGKESVNAVVRRIDLTRRLLGREIARPQREIDFRLSFRHQRALDEEYGIYGIDDAGAETGLWGDEDDDDALPPDELNVLPLTAEEAIAAARRALDEGQDLVASIPPPALPPTLSTKWLVMAWTGLFGAPDDDETASIERASAVIDQASSKPGLIGAASVFHSLNMDGFWPSDALPFSQFDGGKFSASPTRAEIRALRKGERRLAEHLAAERLAMCERLGTAMAEERTAECSGISFVRFILPFVLREFCSLPFPLFPTQAFLAHFRHDTAFAYESTDEADAGALARFARAVASCADDERERMDDLDRLLATWESRLAFGKSRIAAKTKSALRLLVSYPVVDSGTYAKVCGIKRRMAQIRLHELERAGVLSEMTGRYAERMWLANGMR